MWKLVPAGVTLRDQVNRRFPRRDKASDGTVGDRSHAARASDHNPDPNGWVHAIDIDDDLGAPGDAQRLADQLLEYAKSGKPGANRIRYVVYNDKIASGTYPGTFWTWRPSGERKHRNHIHISFTKAAQTDGSEFPLPILKAPSAAKSAVKKAVKKVAKKAPAKKTPAKKAAAK
jgi:hypothetical protein